MRSWWQFDRPAVGKKTRFGRQYVVTIVMDYGMYRFTLRCMDAVLIIPLVYFVKGNSNVIPLFSPFRCDITLKYRTFFHFFPPKTLLLYL